MSLENRNRESFNAMSTIENYSCQVEALPSGLLQEGLLPPQLNALIRLKKKTCTDARRAAFLQPIYFDEPFPINSRSNDVGGTQWSSHRVTLSSNCRSSSALE